MLFGNIYKKFNNFEGFLEDYFYKIVFSIAYFILFIKLIIPYWLFNDLLTWDSAGLYFSSWYQKFYLFPKIIGWNPFFFAGYTQHQFYPPLYAYLTSALSMFMPLETAFKIILVSSLILTPLAIYYCSRKFGFTKNKSSLIMFFLFSLLFIIKGNSYGGDFHSTFNVGLICNSVALMLLFFYIGLLEKYYGKNNYLIVSIVLSLIILTHIFTSMAAGFILFCFSIFKLIKKADFLWLIKHLGLSFLLTAFWTLPFITKFNWTNAISISSGNNYFLVLILFSVIALRFSLTNKKNNLLPLITFIFLTLTLSLLLNKYTNLPIHFYRFMIFVYLITGFIFIALIKKEIKIIYLFVIIFLSLILLNITDIYPEGTPDMKLTSKLPENITGRTLIVASYNKETSPHRLQSLIPLENELIAVKGLYIESAKNSKYSFYIEEEIDPGGSLVWGTYLDRDFFPKNDSVIQSILPYQLDLFNINYIIGFENERLNNFNKIIPISKLYGWHYDTNKIKEYSYNLYQTDSSELVQILNYTPKTIEKNSSWDLEIRKWFLTEKIKEGIFIENNSNLNISISQNIYTDSKIDWINHSKTYGHINFYVNSSVDVPILIKMSYFPNWKAYQNNKEIPISLASPYFMLIYSKGDIELRYKNLVIDHMANSLSLLGLVIVIIILSKKIYKKNDLHKKDL